MKERPPIVDEYARLAADYDTRWSRYIEATTRETIARLRIAPHDRVLDVGCGTGVLLERLVRASPDARFAGIDPVPEMLAIARRRLPEAVELREGWAERIPYADASFDVVVSCNMFHYIRQPLAALGEMGRVLRPGGEIVITDWCDDYWACRLCDWYLRMASPAHVKVYRERECLRLLNDAGYRDARVERYKIDWLWGLMTANVVKAAA